MNAIKLISSIEKNAAPSAIRATTRGKMGLSTIASAAIATKIVPIIPVVKQAIFLHRHFERALGAVIAPKYTPKIKSISDNTLIPKAIHTAILINGIKPKLNNTPTIVPNTILTIIAIQQLMPEPHF